MKRSDRREIYEQFMNGFCVYCLAMFHGITTKKVEEIICKCGE